MILLFVSAFRFQKQKNVFPRNWKDVIAHKKEAALHAGISVMGMSVKGVLTIACSVPGPILTNASSARPPIPSMPESCASKNAQMGTS